jgi:hypothetical protein
MKEEMKMIPYNPQYGNFRTRKFKQIFESTEQFIQEYKDSDIAYNISISDDELSLVYALLYARYGNSTIASDDENQFKYRVYSLIFMYAPTWLKRLEIQEDLRFMTIEELQLGGKAIYNTALNPSSLPSTSSLDELTYINQQNTTNYRKSKLEAYSILTSLLETDVTEQFIGRFKKLFITIVQPDSPLWYITTPEEQEILNQ